MLKLLAILIAVLSLGVLTAGLLALLSNPNKKQNRWFFVLTTSIAVWMPFNFFDSNFSVAFWTHLALKVDFIAALFIAWSFLEFVESIRLRYVKKRLSYIDQNILQAITFVLNLLFAILILGNLLVDSSLSKGELVVMYLPAFIVYVILLMAYFITAFSRLFYKKTKATVTERPALNVILGGFIVAVFANLLTNLLFPLLITDREVVKSLNIFGYLGLLIFVLAIYFAITTQKLLDIRPIVTRSLAYVFSLATVGSVFIVITFTVTNFFLSGTLNSNALQWLYAFFAVLLALTFTPLKHYFDKLTNALFYRDSYDTQAFLDQFNKILVSTFDLSVLLRKSAIVIEENLKLNFTLFDITATEHTTRRVIGSNNHPHLGDADIKAIQAMSLGKKTKVFVVDSFDDAYVDVQKDLKNSGVAAFIRLSSVNNKEGVGYLILGSKKSGALYSTQDAKVLEIVANELVIAVQNALRTEEIQNFNLTLQEKVNEATRKLRRTNEKLKALDEAKDDFVSMASHQLRTPLTSIKGYTSMVLEGDAGKINATQRKLLEQSFWSSQRMVYLIADLLNVSRLKTGKFIIEPVAVNLAEVVEQEIVQLKETAAGRNLTLTYSRPDTFPDLMLDETKTRQVIMNFVDNAIYYTPAGGHIEVKLVETPSSVELRVVDDGIGVPKSEQPHLFTKFYRAGNARKARPDGTGLGLFMAKKVVVAEGGAVIFETEEGKGSTFGFSFPKGLKAAPSK